MIKFGMGVALLSVLVSHAAVAGIQSPASVYSSSGSLFDPGHLIDQSGLFPRFIEGEDFATYVAMGPLAFHTFGEAVWFTSSTSLNAPAQPLTTLFFSFNDSVRLTDFALWNLGPNDPSSVKRFVLSLSNDPFFDARDVIGSFEAGNNSERFDDLTPAQVFSIGSVEARYVRMQVYETHGPNAEGVGFNEIAFNVSPVPEPSSAMLLLAGGAALVLAAAKRRRE